MIWGMKGGMQVKIFFLGCADFKMLLRNTDSEISLIRQLDVGVTVGDFLVLKQIIPQMWNEITLGERCKARK